MKTSVIAALMSVAVIIASTNASDCFSYTNSKPSTYLEVLPAALFYGAVDWITVDATKSCTFATTSDVTMNLYSTDLTV